MRLKAGASPTFEGRTQLRPRGTVREPMKRAALLAIVCLVLAAPAAAAIGPWTPASIKALVRSVGYPKPHPKKLVCKQRSAASFKCTATYRRKQVFYVWLDRGSESSATSGGWLC